MGLGVAAAMLIVMIAASSGGARLLEEWSAGTHRIDLARDAKWTRERARELTEVDIVSVTWTGILLQKLTIQAKNTGETTLSVAKTNLLIDGRLRDGDVSSITIGGATFDTWLPQETLVIVASNVATQPLFVEVVASNGARAYWRP